MSDILPVTVSDTAIFGERGYAFNRLLGEGSYAKVWLVTYQNTVNDDESKEVSLACKIVDSKRAPRDFINKFLPREMDVLTKINHPHLIHLHSIYQRKSKFFIFMRFAEKGDLLDHILAHGEVKENQARLWARQLALGLQYLHELDIVHRDIKCENVLITANNNVKLADFGFSRFIVDSSGKRYLSSTYCGSLAYAAPELLKGKPYDPKRSDIWSLGVVLYVMLNQCMPFNDSDMKKLYDLQMNSKWSFRTKISATVTEDVKALVRKMLEPIAVQRIIIEDVVNSSWFAIENRLKEMSPREQEALDAGMRNKSGLLPKSLKLNIPSWKKRKKEEQQLVCVTSLRFERSSNQFSFETTATRTPVERTAATTVSRDVPTTSRDVTTTSRDVPTTSRDVPTTPRDVPTTSRDVPTISREIPATSREFTTPKDVPTTHRDAPLSISRDVQATTSRDFPTHRDVGTPSKYLITSKEPTAISRDAMRTKSKRKYSEIKSADTTKSKTEFETRKGKESTIDFMKKQSDEAIQKPPQHIAEDKKKSEDLKRMQKESLTEDRKKRADNELKKEEGSPSGVTMNVLVKPRISRADRFMSLDEMPRVTTSKAVIGTATPRVTEPRVAVAPETSRVTELKVAAVPEASQTNIPKAATPGEPVTLTRIEPSQVSGFIKAGKAETLAEIREDDTEAENEPEIEDRLSEISDDIG